MTGMGYGLTRKDVHGRASKSLWGETLLGKVVSSERTVQEEDIGGERFGMLRSHDRPLQDDSKT
jgi:hypothetical protein